MKKGMCGRYIEYLKDNPEGYWFKKKWYGWGWTPATREGWLATLVLVGLVLTLAFRLDEKAGGTEVVKELLLPLVGLVIVFIFIAYKKGEKPEWSWGEPEESQDVINDSKEENHPTT